IVAGDGITFAHPVPISAGVNGERTAKNVQELLNVKTTKSGKNHGWRGLQRSKPVYTSLSLCELGQGFAPTPPKGVALRATPLPRIDLLRRFVSCCFFSVFFVYLSHPG
ncbi:hypothetical protein ACRWDR_24825, partial [Escherichia coli]